MPIATRRVNAARNARCLRERAGEGDVARQFVCGKEALVAQARQRGFQFGDRRPKEPRGGVAVGFGQCRAAKALNHAPVEVQVHGRLFAARSADGRTVAVERHQQQRHGPAAVAAPPDGPHGRLRGMMGQASDRYFEGAAALAEGEADGFKALGVGERERAQVEVRQERLCAPGCRAGRHVAPRRNCSRRRSAVRRHRRYSMA